ncbi:hypothetical protein BSKO_09478 [Bryopsis sp. KO-2023]|nr:hypothetical protein BSKO_09478 [Bryopsis sp. KO-2023]
MFSSFISALQGGAPVDDDDENSPRPAQQQARAGEGSVGFSLWGVAEAVASSVKESANEFVSSVQETDWKSELATFGKTVQNETAEIGAMTVKAVETLPESGIPLPDFGPRGKEVQQQLHGMGSSISRFGKGLVSSTRGILQQAIDTIDHEMESVQSSPKGSRRGGRSSTSLSTMKYSRFESEVSAMQRDSGTYCDEPENEEEFAEWKDEFDLVGQKSDIEELIKGNAFMAELQSRIVPLIVEYDVFWTRYFFRLHKLQEKHKLRQELAERATRLHEEEEQAAWDDDFDMEDEDDEAPPPPPQQQDPKIEAAKEASQHQPIGAETSQERQSASVSLSKDEEGGEKSRDADVDVAASDFRNVSLDDAKEQKLLPVSTSAGGQPQPLASALATIPVESEESSGRTASDESPSARVKTATESDTVEMESTSDGSGNRGWCVVTSPRDKSGLRSAAVHKDDAGPSTDIPEAISENTDDEDEDEDGEDDGEAVDEDWGNWD